MQGTTLPLRVEVSQHSRTGGDVTLASPAQNAFGIEGAFTLNACAISMAFPSIAAHYEAIIDPVLSVMNGQWMQSGTQFPLELSRQRPVDDGAAAASSRGAAVTFQSADGQTMLTGEITQPLVAPNGIGVILLSGSGSQDLDQTIFGHRPFAVWAEFLSARNVTVLRYNDRGVNGSGGDGAHASLDDLADDAAGAVDALPDTVTQTYLIGHSEGAVVAALTANRVPSIDGVVLLSPQVAPLADVLIHQIRTYMTAEGHPVSDIEAMVDAQTRINEIAVTEADEDRRTAQIRDILLAMGEDEESAAMRAGVASSEAFRSRLTVDPRTVYSALSIPTLAIFGAKDTQIRPVWSADALRNLTDPDGNAPCVLTFDALNHLLQTAGTGMPDEYALIEETIAVSALEAVADWVVSPPGERRCQQPS